jgi:hypothetical protein
LVVTLTTFPADRLSGFGVGVAFVAVFLEPVGALLGAFDERGILVADLAAQLDEQRGAVGRPHRGDEQPLLRCPLEPGRLHAGVHIGG